MGRRLGAPRAAPRRLGAPRDPEPPYLPRMHTTRLSLCLAAAALNTLACSGKEAAPPPSGAEAIAQVAAAKSLPAEKYSSPTSGFDLQLPGIWKGRYRALERADTLAGARTAIEFRFVPDSGSKAPSLTLMTIRIFPKAAWAVASKRVGRPIGGVIGESAKDVFVLSLPEGNPYPAASPEAPEFDKLIISIAQGGQQIHLTIR